MKTWDPTWTLPLLPLGDGVPAASGPLRQTRYSVQRTQAVTVFSAPPVEAETSIAAF